MKTFKSFDSLPSTSVVEMPVVSRPASKEYEPRSPKSMSQRICGSTAKSASQKHWSYGHRPRTPKNRETSPRVRFVKGKFYIGQMDEPLDNLDQARARLKELGYLRYYWFGALKMVG